MIRHKQSAVKAVTLWVAIPFLFASPSLAQDAPEASTEPLFAVLDSLSDAAIDEQAGINLAGDLAKEGRYLEAIATLERVLAAYPKSHNARILHAVFLCDIDDKQGGLVELSQIKKRHVGEEAMNAALARCGGEVDE